MKVFITGSSGFVGSTLYQELTASGHEVTVLTRAVKNKGEACREARRFWKEIDPGGSMAGSCRDHDASLILPVLHIRHAGMTVTKKNCGKAGSLRPHLVEAMETRKGKEKRTLSAPRSVGSYGFHGDETD
jgi:NAD dependent epimerase/dehydratase family enzyme